VMSTAANARAQSDVAPRTDVSGDRVAVNHLVSTPRNCLFAANALPGTTRKNALPRSSSQSRCVARCRSTVVTLSPGIHWNVFTKPRTECVGGACSRGDGERARLG
jgi:hypothetical protein